MTSNLNSTVVSHTYLHIILHDYLSCPLFCPVSENGHLGNKDLLLNISFCYCSSAEMFLHWLPKTSTVPMTKIFFSSYFSSDPVNDRSSWNFPFPGCYSWLTLLLLTFSFSFFWSVWSLGAETFTHYFSTVKSQILCIYMHSINICCMNELISEWIYGKYQE